MWLIYLSFYTLIHFAFVYNCHINGSMFYNNRINNGKITPKVFDIGIKYTPNLSNNKLLHMLNDFIAIGIPFLFGNEVFYEYVKYFLVIVLIRDIFTNVTILPKDKECKDTELSMYSFLTGHCYDKIFSGHFSSFFLLTLILLQKGIIKSTFAIVINILYGLLIISLRSHYTIDIIIAAVVVLSVKTNLTM